MSTQELEDTATAAAMTPPKQEVGQAAPQPKEKVVNAAPQHTDEVDAIEDNNSPEICLSHLLLKS